MVQFNHTEKGEALYAMELSLSLEKLNFQVCPMGDLLCIMCPKQMGFTAQPACGSRSLDWSGSAMQPTC